MKEIVIVGAGTSGLIMAEVLSANGFDCRILEKRTESEYFCSFNSRSVYYYHNDNINKIMPIPLKQVKIQKTFYDFSKDSYIQPTAVDIFNYTAMDNGHITNSSIEECGKEIIGYIEDNDLNLMSVLYSRNWNKIAFNVDFDFSNTNNWIVINTAPLPICVSKTLGKDRYQFKLSSATTIHAYKVDQLNLDSIFVAYCGGSNRLCKRVCCIGDKMFIEGKKGVIEDIVYNLFGWACTYKEIGNYSVNNIVPMDVIERKNLLFELTKEFSIFNLGRYATWSYKRIDHVVQDAQDIVKMIRFSQMGRW